MDKLKGPRAKVERADKHIAELESTIKGFIDGDPYEVLGEEEAETGHLVLRLHEKIPLPSRNISLIAGDAVHNLRSALDLLYCALVKDNGGTPGTDDAFRISKHRKSFESGALPEIEKRLSSGAFKVMSNLQPYRGGHNPFWQLHQLDIIDKHRLLLTTTASVGEVIQTVSPVGEREIAIGGGLTVSGIKLAYAPADKRCPLNDGDEVLRQTTKPHHDVEFAFQVALHEPPIVECEAILPFLTHLSSGVGATISLFEPILNT